LHFGTGSAVAGVGLRFGKRASVQFFRRAHEREVQSDARRGWQSDREHIIGSYRIRRHLAVVDATYPIRAHLIA